MQALSSVHGAGSLGNPGAGHQGSLSASVALAISLVTGRRILDLLFSYRSQKLFVGPGRRSEK